MSQNTPHQQAGPPPESLLKAINRVLRPFVRLLLHFQITYPFLSELLKKIYVEVAEQEFKLPGKKQTDTRISLLTGVHRKDTRRLRGQPFDDPPPKTVSLGAQLIAHWINDPQLQDENGNPRPLPLKGPGPNFESFVQQLCRQNMRARVVLDEWLRLGVVYIENEQVHLKEQAFIPEKSLDDKAYFLGLNIGDHIAAATHNLTQSKDPLFERCVYYHGLEAEDLVELEALARSKGMEMLKALNEKALALQKPKPGPYRFTTGVYFYTNLRETVPESDN